jgi:hypothetical protein
MQDDRLLDISAQSSAGSPAVVTPHLESTIFAIIPAPGLFRQLPSDAYFPADHVIRREMIGGIIRGCSRGQDRLNTAIAGAITKCLMP